MNKINTQTKYFYDDLGRIIRVQKNDNYALINWAEDGLDVDFCNFIIKTVCEIRGVAGDIENE